eukprot:CAMPEP_0175970376 /NCGR_PEP_ID=MMETSP0108-20121206/41018_1 /TAXON_ID=195067 ORGANISM="Goniomonas pacifica, Strain CCMP1869" /NCGR_SAMPLE_ID=MMETSP0108 /ASSEMBLY_ACC=CAM_ASM_000204 /LENGTH=45 /DNA_ID= /DNA_START= /DNA_END= /DNA_ORIENTATION=
MRHPIKQLHVAPLAFAFQPPVTQMHRVKHAEDDRRADHEDELCPF